VLALIFIVSVILCTFIATPFYVVLLRYLSVDDKLWSRGALLALIGVSMEAVFVAIYYFSVNSDIPYFIELFSFGFAALVVTIYIRKYMSIPFGRVFWGANLASYASGLLIGLFIPG
jgi:hypothetical protein